jgi:hypothetical protein
VAVGLVAHSLVGAVDALLDAVAHGRRRDAPSVRDAPELALGAVASGAVDLVGAVAAVVVVVAPPPARDAPAVGTLEVGWFTGRCTAIFWFVAVIVLSAVAVSVAPPRKRHTPARLVALEVAVRTLGCPAIFRLVRFVSAVVVAVAPPNKRYAPLVGTFELVTSTRRDRAVLLVRSVVTVLYSVTSH